jgi:hypothetical protein
MDFDRLGYDLFFDFREKVSQLPTIIGALRRKRPVKIVEVHR